MNTELKLWENSEIVFLLNCFFLYLSDFLRCSFFILYQVYHVSGKMLQSWCFYDTACGTLLHCDMLPTLCQFFLAVDIGIWMLFGTFLNSYFQREPIRTVKNSQFVVESGWFRLCLFSPPVSLSEGIFAEMNQRLLHLCFRKDNVTQKGLRRLTLSMLFSLVPLLFFFFFF